MDLDDKKVKKKKIGQLPSSLTEQAWPKLNTCIVYQLNKVEARKFGCQNQRYVSLAVASTEAF